VGNEPNEVENKGADGPEGTRIEAAGREISRQNLKTIANAIRSLYKLIKKIDPNVELEDGEWGDGDFDPASGKSADSGKRAVVPVRAASAEAIDDIRDRCEAIQAGIGELLNRRPAPEAKSDPEEQEAEAKVFASRFDLSGESEVRITASVGDGNAHDIVGVLFRIDEPSESAPSMGSLLPLYVPAEVAAEAVATVNNKPIDVSDKLDRHSLPDIVGVMTGARVDGQDFLVEGKLWPYNQEERVKSILANKQILGMSMNAAAVGRETEVDGTRVFAISKLDILGANILYSERATYAKTRLVSASSAGEETDNSGEYPPTTDTEMDEDIKYQLNQLSSLIQEFGSQIDSTDDRVTQLSASVKELVEERQQQLQASHAEMDEQRQARDRDELIEKITEKFTAIVDEKISPLQEQVQVAAASATANGRKSVPLRPGVGTSPGAGGKMTEIQASLEDKRSCLEKMREEVARNPNRATEFAQQRIRLIEEIGTLEAQIGGDVA